MSHMNRPKDSPEPGLIPLPIGSSGTPLSQRSVPLPVSSPGSDPESCFSSPILSLLPSLSSLPPSSLSPHSDLLDSDNSEGSGRNVTKVLERNRSLTPQQLRSSPREFTPPHASKSSAPAVSFCHSSPIGIRSSPLSPSPSVQLRERERLHLPSSGAHRLRSSSPPKLPRNTMHLKLSHVPQLPPPLDNPPPGTRYPSENQIKTKELLSKLAHKTESETEERAILPPPFFCLPPLLCYSGDLSPDLSHDKKHFGRYNTSGGEVGGNIHEIFADGKRKTQYSSTPVLSNFQLKQQTNRELSDFEHILETLSPSDLQKILPMMDDPQSQIVTYIQNKIPNVILKSPQSQLIIEEKSPDSSPSSGDVREVKKRLSQKFKRK